MSQINIDFAVIGATPLARLLTGQLATAHGKSVILVGQSQSAYRLPRALDLSVGAITRPESWALLTAGTPETLKLLSRIGGRGTWFRVDPILFARGAAEKEALAHIRHMAAAYGVSVERVPRPDLPNGDEGIVLRDAVQLHRPALESALHAWLDKNGVTRVAAPTLVAPNDHGGAEIHHENRQYSARQLILADDEALLEHVSPENWPSLLQIREAATILAEPTPALPAAVMQLIDNGTILAQSAARGVVGLGAGELENFASEFKALLGPGRPFVQAGQARYRRVLTKDGAPAVGRLGQTGSTVLAGLGLGGAFLAPTLGRWLCGAPSDAENAWLNARMVSRDTSSAVTDFGAAA